MSPVSQLPPKPACPEDDPVSEAEAPLPPKLQGIVDFFSGLSDEEKRENLILYSDMGKRCEPKPSEAGTFSLEDVRKDEECADTVGLFLKVDPATRGVTFRVTLGPEVQTLTKAMTAVLCKGLDGITPEQVLSVPATFVPRIVGAQLVRVRSQTTYYVLTRMKSVCKVWLDRERAKAHQG